MDIKQEPTDSTSSKKSTQNSDQESNTSLDNYEHLPLIQQLFGDDTDDDEKTLKPTVEIKSYFDEIRSKREKKSSLGNAKTTTEAVLPVDQPIPGCSKWSDEYARQKEFERETKCIVKADETIQAYIPREEPIHGSSVWGDTYARRKLMFGSGANYIAMGDRTNLNIPTPECLKWCDTNFKINIKKACDLMDEMDESAKNESTPGSSKWTDPNFKIRAKKTCDLMDAKGEPAKNEPTPERLKWSDSDFKIKVEKPRDPMGVKYESDKVFIPIYEPVPGCSKWSDSYLQRIQLERESDFFIDSDEFDEFDEFDGVDEIAMHYNLIEEDKYALDHTPPPNVTYKHEKENNNVVIQNADSTTNENSVVAKSNTKSIIVDRNMSDIFGENKYSKNIYDDYKRYSCDRCDFKCRHIFELNNHDLNHSSERQYMGKTSPYKSQRISDLKSYGKIYDNNTIYACKHCDYICTHSFELYNHEATHSLIRPNVCNHCSYTSNNLNDLRIHKLIHSPVNTFQCTKCQYKSKSYNVMKAHEKTHTRPFVCSKCPYTTVKMTDLINHTNTHITKLPYVCNFCQKSYSSSRGLRHHKIAAAHKLD